MVFPEYWRVRICDQPAVSSPHQRMTMSSQQHDSRELVAGCQSFYKVFDVRTQRGIESLATPAAR